MNPSQISEAVVAWTGWQETPWPQRSEERLANRLGPDQAALLMPYVRSWADDFYMSDARAVAPSLQAMGAQAEEDFRKLHPEASDDAVHALGWCYTFDFK